MTIGQERCFSKSGKIEPLMIETTRKRIAEIIDALEKEKGDKNTAQQVQKSKGFSLLHRINWKKRACSL